MIDSAADQQHSFVVRLWYESGGANAPGQWRGSVEHVPSGQRRYFIELGDLTEFVASKLEAPPHQPAVLPAYSGVQKD